MLKKILVTLSLVAFLSGCNTVASNRTSTQQALVDDTNPRAQLVLGNKKLLNKVIYRDVKFGTVGNFTKAQFQLENLSDMRIGLEYQIIWQDSAGFNVLTDSSWHRFTLGPRQVKTIQSVGKTPESTNIQVVVRLPDDLFIESHKREQAAK